MAIAGGATTTKKYIAPTPKSATAVMSKAVAPTTSARVPGPATASPTRWPGVQIDPTTDGIGGAIPIGGFTFIDLYTCYADANTVTALVGTTAPVGFFNWYYGSSTVNASIPKDVLTVDGASPVPGTWAIGDQEAHPDQQADEDRGGQYREVRLRRSRRALIETAIRRKPQSFRTVRQT